MKCKPSNKTNDTHQPEWWDIECEQAKKEKYLFLRHFRQSNSRRSLDEYLCSKKRFKTIVYEKKLNHKRVRKQNLVNLRKCPKQFWKSIKGHKPQKDVTQNIPTNDWFEYFKSLLNPQIDNENQNGNLLAEITQNNDASDLNVLIAENEVKQSIIKLHTNKSPGPDGLPAEFFKCTMEHILPYLTTLFNNIFESGNIPDSWGNSIICPLHKKGSLFDPNNFRGVSLINTICKMFTNILTSRLDKWTEKFNVIHESQAGFRRQYSTVDNIFTLHAVTQKYLCKKGGRFYCLFIDFRKAFDSIDHDKLWDALTRKGIEGNFLRIWKSLYSKLKSCVKVDENLTNYFDCTIGTRQGCVGSPKIFSLFINDLISYLESKLNQGIFITTDIDDVLTLMFADDVSCFADTVVGLQRLLNELSVFCKSVGLHINFDKTKIIVFRNGGPLRMTEKWVFDGKNIEVVSFYKYLGIFFTPKLVWTKTLESQALQGLKASASIFKFQKNFGFFSPQDIFKLFDTIVKPVLCYGSEIWGYRYYDKIEKIQSKFCKRFCCLSANTSDFMALGECGRLPIAITYMTRCLSYWIKLLRMENYRYPKQSYLMLKRLDGSGKTTWASPIKSMLFRFGFGYIWISQDVGNSKLLMHLFTERLKDCYFQEWLSKVADSEKAEHYKHFKSLLEVEKYLTLELCFKFRQALAKFRCSSHNLMIEKGRHLDLDRIFRNCPFCLKRNIYTIEDEYHFLMVCPQYEDIRYIYFPENMLNYVTIDKFYNFISSRNEQMITSLAKYLYYAFERRKIMIV